MDDPVISPRAVERFQPVLGKDADGADILSTRTYLLAPLSWRERIAYRAELSREAGAWPSDEVALAALREAVRASGASNTAALLEAMDLAAAEPANEAAQVALKAVQAHLASAPAYAALMAQRQQHLEAMPWVAARHCLRGWEGPDLPEFHQLRGLVPFDLLEKIPEADVVALGYRANALTRMDRRAEGNSPSPSPLPVTPEPAAAN